MKKSNILAFIFILLLALSASVPSSAQLLCENIFQSQKAEEVLFAKGSNFTHFEELKEKYTEQIQNKDWKGVEQLKTDVQKMAFLEAYGDYKKNDFFSWVKIHSEDSSKSSQYLNFITKLNMKKPMSKVQMEKLFERLYAISNPVPGFLKKLFIGPSAQDLIKQRIDYEIGKHDFYSMMKNLGLIRQDRLLDRYNSRQRSVMKYTGLVLGAATSFIASSAFWDANFTRKFTSRLEFEETGDNQTLVTGGEGNIVLAGRTDATLARTKRIFTGFLAAMVLTHLQVSELTVKNVGQKVYGDWEAAEGIYDLATKKEAKVDMKILAESMDSDLYRMWAEGYRQAYDKEPDPMNHYLDQAMWIHYIIALPSPDQAQSGTQPTSQNESEN
jgi:hypothetical protein